MPSEHKPDEKKPVIEAKDERRIFEAFLQSRGLRLTRPRKIIFEEVFRVHGHVDAEELSTILRGPGKRVSRASVYRTLDLLAEAGLVKPVRLGGKEQRLYEHVHSGEHHDHLICDKCGKIIEFFCGEIEALQSGICREKGFQPATHSMIIYGICARCRRTGKGSR